MIYAQVDCDLVPKSRSKCKNRPSQLHSDLAIYAPLEAELIHELAVFL
jgi:hypothetical protein